MISEVDFGDGDRSKVEVRPIRENNGRRGADVNGPSIII